MSLTGIALPAFHALKTGTLSSGDITCRAARASQVTGTSLGEVKQNFRRFPLTDPPMTVVVFYMENELKRIGLKQIHFYFGPKSPDQNSNEKLPTKNFSKTVLDGTICRRQLTVRHTYHDTKKAVGF